MKELLRLHTGGIILSLRYNRKRQCYEFKCDFSTDALESWSKSFEDFFLFLLLTMSLSALFAHHELGWQVDIAGLLVEILFVFAVKLFS